MKLSVCARACLLIGYLLTLYGWHVFLSAAFLPPPRLHRPPASPPPPLPTPLPPPSPSPPPSTSPPPPPAPPPPLLPTCGDVHPHTEYDGAVMVPGVGAAAPAVRSAGGCCAACGATRGCNVWVWCAAGWCAGQCWLKWTDRPEQPAVRARGDGVAWASGALRKDAPAALGAPEEARLNATRVVALRTARGEIRIKLRPEWHLPSVRFVQQAAVTDSCTVKCELYRAEPGFLLQGAMRAIVPPNKVCRAFRGGPEECTDSEERPGGSVMRRGDVAWAGGSAGPDFFITMGTVNGFGATHTVWGSVADEESMALVLQLVKGASSSKPGTMRILDEPVRFTVTDASSSLQR